MMSQHWSAHMHSDKPGKEVPRSQHRQFSRYNPRPCLEGPRPSIRPRVLPQVVNPRVLGRQIDRMIGRDDIMMRHVEPVLLRIEASLPRQYAPNVFNSRAPTAWNHWGLPKLLKEMSSTDHDVAVRALLTLVDSMHDEVVTFKAVHLGVVPKIGEFLFEKVHWLRERSLALMVSVVRTPFGRDVFLMTPELMEKIKTLMKDEKMMVRLRAAQVLHHIVLVRTSENEVDEKDLADYSFHLLDKEVYECVLQVHLFNLQKLLDLIYTREVCIGHGALDALRRVKKKLTDIRLVASVTYLLTRHDLKRYEHHARKSTGHKKYKYISVMAEATPKSEN